MKERRYARWRRERLRYRDNYVVQEGKLVNTGQRWMRLDKVENRMHKVFRKRVEREVEHMKSQTRKTAGDRDERFENLYLTPQGLDSSVFEEPAKSTEEKHADDVGLIPQGANRPNRANIELLEK